MLTLVGNRTGWGIGGALFVVAALVFFFSGEVPIGIAFLVVGLVFLVNGGRRQRATTT